MLSHSDFVICSNDLRFQNGMSSGAMMLAFRDLAKIRGRCPPPGDRQRPAFSLHLVPFFSSPCDYCAIVRPALIG
jgi:hypothetical protein